MKLLIPTILTASILIAACAQKKNDTAPAAPPPPSLITTANPQLVDIQNKAEQGLQGSQLAYDSKYKDFGADQKPLLPCEPAFLNSLAAAQKSMAEVQTDIHKDNLELYRDKALEFQRKVDNQQKSLSTITDLIQPYCAQEHSAVMACMDSQLKQPLRIFINLRVAGYMKVHPLFIPNKNSEWMFLNGLDETGLRAKNINTGEYPSENDVTLLIKNSSKMNLKSISDCLATKKLQTPIAQQIQKSVLEAIKESSARCTQLADIFKTRQIKPTDLEQKFCSGIQSPAKPADKKTSPQPHRGISNNK